MSKVRVPGRDLTGMRFGKFTVIEYVGRNRTRQALYACLCDCGKAKIVLGFHLLDGASTTCGCSHIGRHAEQFRKMGLGNKGRVWRPKGEKRPMRCDLIDPPQT